MCNYRTQVHAGRYRACDRLKHRFDRLNRHATGRGPHRPASIVLEDIFTVVLLVCMMKGAQTLRSPHCTQILLMSFPDWLAMHGHA